MQNLAAAFAASASVHSDKPALYWGESRFSYRHHADHAAALAQMLVTRLGVRPGDRVGIWLKNCPEFVTALFGILGAGAVVVPINNFLKPGEVGYLLADAGVDVLIAESATAAACAEVATLRPGLRVLTLEDFPVPSGPVAFPVGMTARGRDDLAVLIFTSGTAGSPKAAMLTHGTLLANLAGA